LSGSEPLAAALRLLAVRDRSEAELGQLLRRRGFPEPQVDAVLGRCRELGYLDDSRCARARARALTHEGRAVGRRLLLELQRGGIDQATAARAAAEAEDELPAAAVLAALRQRRFPGFVWAEAADRERKRVADYFLRRGFPLSLVLSFFQEER
jgi:regulatory protein